MNEEAEQMERIEKLWDRMDRAYKALATKQNVDTANNVADCARALAEAMQDADALAEAMQDAATENDYD